MGPNDPYGSASFQEAPAPTTDPAPRAARSLEPIERRPNNPVALGFGVGVATGLLSLLTSFPDALAVLGLGLLGAAAGAAIQAIAPVSMNLRAAVQALLGRE